MHPHPKNGLRLFQNRKQSSKKRGMQTGSLTPGLPGRKPKNRQEVTMTIQEGKAAPPFTLPDASGRMVSLDDFAGKNVVVYFYPKDNTSG